MKLLKFLLSAVLLLSIVGCGQFVPIPVPTIMYPGTVSGQGVKTAIGIVRISDTGEAKLLSVSGHGSECITGVQAQGNALRVNFCESTTEVLGFSVPGDECLGRYTATGAQGMADHMLVHFGVATPRFVQYRFTYDGTLWQGLKLDKSRPVTVDLNTSNLVKFTHPKAELLTIVEDHSANVNYRTHFSKQYTNTQIFIDGTPQAGDAFSVYRELDLKNPDKLAVPLDEVVGGYFCNVTIEFYYR